MGPKKPLPRNPAPETPLGKVYQNYWPSEDLTGRKTRTRDIDLSPKRPTSYPKKPAKKGDPLYKRLYDMPETLRKALLPRER